MISAMRSAALMPSGMFLKTTRLKETSKLFETGGVLALRSLRYEISRRSTRSHRFSTTDAVMDTSLVISCVYSST